jgi:hypothetical protein
LPPGTADSQRSSKTRVYLYLPSDSPDHCGVVGAFFLPATGPRILPTMPARAEALQFLHHRRCLLLSCARQFISFQDLADKLKLDVHALMKQCNA